MRIRVTSDSTCDLSRQYLQNHQVELLPLIDLLFCEVNPIPVKTAMARMGLCSDLLRLPLCEMSEENRARLFAAMDACGVSA